ncbi:uncharacterized protein LOC117579961 isoform X2 [Drosophila guanche]|uniref:uncharacterized protein LOC117579961 isoform X2 n=1 Tax=Drosophila guanche TaxID=7266 RepID=UPI00147153EB|nr:uncharacterized protein LOC117579961 isoform X2 [Drosophila guanche]
MTSPISTAVQRRRQLLHSVESLRGRVLESDVAALLDEVRALNDDHEEMQRLDRLIETLRDYSGPTICHEWPYPLIFKGTIDEAHVAQILNGGGSELEVPTSYPKEYNIQLESNTEHSKRSRFLRFPRRTSSRRLQSAD